MLSKLVSIGGLFLFSISVSWNFCMGGDAYGMPFPVVFPSHFESAVIMFFELQPNMKNHGLVFSPLSILGNLLASISVYYLIIWAANKVGLSRAH